VSADRRTTWRKERVRTPSWHVKSTSTPLFIASPPALSWKRHHVPASPGRFDEPKTHPARSDTRPRGPHPRGRCRVDFGHGRRWRHSDGADRRMAVVDRPFRHPSRRDTGAVDAYQAPGGPGPFAHSALANRGVGDPAAASCPLRGSRTPVGCTAGEPGSLVGVVSADPLRLHRG
jgi:hypothetical protein